MIKKGGKSEHFFVTHKHFFKKISIILALFGKKQALLLAFNAFFTSTFGKSLGRKGGPEPPRNFEIQKWNFAYNNGSHSFQVLLSIVVR